MADPLMEFDAVLTREHFAEFSAHSMKQFSRAGALRYQGIAYLAIAFVMALGFMRLSNSVARPIDPDAWLGPDEVVMLALMAGMLATLALTWTMSRAINRSYMRDALREGGSYLGPRHFTLDEEGISAQGAHGRALTRWSAMIAMTQAPATFLLWTDPGAAVMVPKNAFDGRPEMRAAFERLANAKIAATNA